MSAPELRTARLLLRHWRPGDDEPFAALNADPEVMAHFPAPLSRADSDAFAARIRAELAERDYGLWAVQVLGGAEFVGFVGLHPAPDALPCAPAVEVGWRLARAAWGHGYASEAAAEVLAYGFERLGLAEVVSFTATTNLRSQAVMQRLGLTRDPAEDFDHPALPAGHRLRRHVLYRMSAPRWRACRRGSAGSPPYRPEV